ncbi:hypothetical protein GQ43DRAFT_138913 [Delitschia confertaspora ATCC 74209]|uniref:RING-type domain-containing protein n=1 Tax=Delitschia confertaspora ATCC 74209 TaxID=1513339 RepID=A0A9P4MN08_9PLEO|nr:hypothetical protein GQ43DRAFT_138913 [Delitschia confertaspora ATCC 74209]
MSSPSPIPPPNDRRSSGASLRAESTSGFSNSDSYAASSQPSALLVRRKSRLIKIPPDVRLLEYVSDCDNNLVCLICHSPFDKPVKLACDHYFCKECLDHAWDAQQVSQQSCPTCRNKVDLNNEPMPVPRILENMLDDLLVKCPNTKSGCTWVNQRANVQDHVLLYCEYTQVECPSYECRLPISQKDYHKGCLHYTVSCEGCHTSMMKKDLEVGGAERGQSRLMLIKDCRNTKKQTVPIVRQLVLSALQNFFESNSRPM